METLVLSFSLPDGDLRLLVGAPSEAMPDLVTSLRGAAVVSDNQSEFIQLAARECELAGGLIGEVMRQNPAMPSLKSRIRRAAEQSDPLLAARMLVSALENASELEVQNLAADVAWESERAYFADLAVGLDDEMEWFSSELTRTVGFVSASALIGGR